MKPALEAKLDVPEYLGGFSVLTRTQNRRGAPRGPRDPELIVRIGKLLVQGLGICAVARQLRVNRRLVYRWRKRLGLEARRPTLLEKQTWGSLGGRPSAYGKGKDFEMSERTDLPEAVRELKRLEAEVEELRKENEALLRIMKLIARPALGGKVQQGMAQQALNALGGGPRSAIGKNGTIELGPKKEGT